MSNKRAPSRPDYLALADTMNYGIRKGMWGDNDEALVLVEAALREAPRELERAHDRWAAEYVRARAAEKKLEAVREWAEANWYRSHDNTGMKVAAILQQEDTE